MNVWHSDLGLDSKQVLVGVRGRLDQSLTPQLEAELRDLLSSGYYHLVVDLSEVSYINSGGLRCLVAAWRQARQQRGDVVLCGLGPRLNEIFAMIGFDKVFRIYPTCQAAVQT
ncbi:MAG: STAS domain-containing protein [Chloroflexota bacterium]